MRVIILSLFLGLIALGCIKEPEGPAERIGKGLDQIAEGLRDIDSQRALATPTPTPTPRPTSYYERERGRYSNRYDSRYPSDTYNKPANDYRGY